MPDTKHFPHPAEYPAHQEWRWWALTSRPQQCKDCLKESIANTAEACSLFSIPVPDEEEMAAMISEALADADAESNAELAAVSG